MLDSDQRTLLSQLALHPESWWTTDEMAEAVGAENSVSLHPLLARLEKSNHVVSVFGIREGMTHARRLYKITGNGFAALQGESPE